MKHNILKLILLVCFSYSYSQTNIPGYYVTKTNDTITAQIKLPKSVFGSVDFSKFLFKVEVNDSINGDKKFKPEDIKSFGFIYKDKKYSLYSQPTITENNIKFLEPVILGQRSSLYKFQTVNQNGAALGTFYTFEKADGSHTFLNTGIRNLDKFRETLKAFYKDNLEVQKIIETKFQNRTSINIDIITIVKTVNEQMD